MLQAQSGAKSAGSMGGWMEGWLVGWNESRGQGVPHFVSTLQAGRGRLLNQQLQPGKPGAGWPLKPGA